MLAGSGVSFFFTTNGARTKWRRQKFGSSFLISPLMQKSLHQRKRSRLARSSFYRDVLKKDLPYIDHIERAKPSKKLPVVFTRREVEVVLARLNGIHHLIACLLYDSGLRLMEAVRLRVKDIDLERGEISVREGKGSHSRCDVLATSVAEPCQELLPASSRLPASRNCPRAFGR